jgi:excinuclease ABC subunit A
VVCGVSGAGKSTLIETILARHLRHQLHRAKALPGAFDTITGMEHLKAVIDIDQSAIGRTPRSNPATYTKLFDRIRDLFAAQPLARERGYKKSRFSFNTKGGRCEVCEGAGVQEIGMHFLDTIAVRCEHCGGKRFNAETLEIIWHDKTIYDVLELTVDDAAIFFASQPKIMKILNVLQAVGLGYITLGQPSTTLSGGEAQRIKLAAELARSTSGTTLYILDEPTTGLHPYDVEQLLKALHQLVDDGNAVVVIEHHPRLLFAADHIIELGPGSGDDGGEITFTGTPEEFKRQTNSPYIQAMHKAAQPDHTTTPDLPDCIQIEGAATHNLHNISLQIPHHKLSVITGVSGSGKSSLAFDTLFAEGNRRFTESISTYARRFMKQLPRPAFTRLDGLSPTIAITQRRSHANPRSTVGTYSGLYDHLRLLYSRVTAAGLSAQHFSFNHDSGACPHCKGLGFHLVPDPAKIITHPHLAIAEGAMNGHKVGKFYGDPTGQHMAILATVGAALNIDFSKPWQQLDERAQSIVMQGTGAQQWDVVWHYKRKNRTGSHQWRTTWDGLIAYIADEFARKQHDKRANELTPLLSEVACQSCAGKRLRPEVLDARIQGKNIMDIAELELHQLHQLLSGWMQERIHPAATAILPQMLPTLQGLLDAGLGYLTLMRRCATLSGGEMQRLRLASQLGGDLCGITYILDEPTSGLHPADTQNLIGLLHRLRDAGNTVIVVEHDLQVIGAADQIFDLGPGAGSRGGTIIAQGTPAEIATNPQSRTGAYLQSPPAKPASQAPASGTRLRFRAAAARNLKGIDIEIPTASITTITGVSGSGKSTLLHQVIAPSILHHHPTNCAACELPLDCEVIAITHKPLASSPISSVATYSGVLNHIAAWFAAQPAAKAANLKKSAFLYNSRQGQCPTCKGAGHTRVSMDFMADVWLPCTSCDGQRYRPAVLSCTAENHTIMDVLNLTVEDAAALFQEHRKIHPPLALLCEIGLGYLPLIQSLSTLSGGEAQRLKLAAHLINTPSQHTVFLLDEPTIGLHSADVEVLMTLLHKLKKAGHTIIVVEHNTDVMRQSDWLIDLGPTGGAEGGELIACGTPAEVAANPASATGRFLQ